MPLGNHFFRESPFNKSHGGGRKYHTYLKVKSKKITRNRKCQNASCMQIPFGPVRDVPFSSNPISPKLTSTDRRSWDCVDHWQHLRQNSWCCLLIGPQKELSAGGVPAIANNGFLLHLRGRGAFAASWHHINSRANTCQM